MLPNPHLLIGPFLRREAVLSSRIEGTIARFEQLLRYIDHVLRVSQVGAWTAWIRSFLRGIAEQSRDAITRAQRLLSLQQTCRDRLQTARASALLLKLVDELFFYPALTVARARDRLGVTTARSAQSNIDKLVEGGILREATGRQYNPVYVAPAIVERLEAETIYYMLSYHLAYLGVSMHRLPVIASGHLQVHQSQSAARTSAL